MIQMLMNFAVSFVLVIITAILGQDARTIVPKFCRSLLRRAAKCIDGPESSDLLEEWLSHLDEQDLLTKKLLHAASLYLYGAARVARELKPDTKRRAAYLRRKRCFEVGMVIFVAPGLILLFIPLVLLLVLRGAKPFEFHPRQGLNGKTIRLIYFNFSAIEEISPWFAHLFVRAGVIHMPNIINVAKGDLSFVGPHAKPLSSAPLAYGVKPGFTGIPGVDYFRGRSDRLSDYGENTSILYDLKVIWFCFSVVFKKKR